MLFCPNSAIKNTREHVGSPFNRIHVFWRYQAAPALCVSFGVSARKRAWYLLYVRRTSAGVHRSQQGAVGSFPLVSYTPPIDLVLIIKAAIVKFITGRTSGVVGDSRFPA